MGRQYRFSWRSVTCRYQFTAYGASRCYRRTISSLHIGHARRLLARAAAFSLGPSRTLLPMSSLVSAVLAGLLDVWLLSDRELSEGDSRLALRTWLCCACGACSACVCGGAGDTAGDRFLPLPSTRPPPRDLREAMVGEEGYLGTMSRSGAARRGSRRSLRGSCARSGRGARIAVHAHRACWALYA
jgi:hypothetical protein